MNARRALVTGHLLSLLAFTTVAVAWAGFVLYKGGALPQIGAKDYEVSAILPSGAALAPGSRVTASGVPVGKIKKVERQGMGARVVLQIENDDIVPLPADSRVQVRQHTPVGENYIAVVPGRSSTRLASGDALPVSQGDEFVDVDRILSVLKGKTRQRARNTIQGLGGPLKGNGERLNRVAGRGAELIKNSGKTFDILHRERFVVARLFDDLGAVATAIGQRDAAVRTLGRRGIVALDAVRDSDKGLRETFAQLPGTLRRVRKVSGTVREVTAVTAPVVDDTTGAVRALRPAVERLRPAARAGDAVLTGLGAAAPGLGETLDEVEALSGPLRATLPQVRKTICQLAPMARYIKPYFPEALYILIGLGSASNNYDASGHVIRVSATVNENSVAGLPDEASRALSELTRAGIVGKSGGTSLNYNFFVPPGSLGKITAMSNRPLGPEDVPTDTNYKYPRITADC